MEERRNHTVVTVTIRGERIGCYGVCRSRKAKHPHIPKQLRLSWGQTQQLARCSLSKEQYESILERKGEIPASSDERN